MLPLQEPTHPIHVCPCDYLSGACVGPMRLKHQQCRGSPPTLFCSNRLATSSLPYRANTNAVIIRHDSDKFFDTTRPPSTSIHRSQPAPSSPLAQEMRACPVSDTAWCDFHHSGSIRQALPEVPQGRQGLPHHPAATPPAHPNDPLGDRRFPRYTSACSHLTPRQHAPNRGRRPIPIVLGDRAFTARFRCWSSWRSSPVFPPKAPLRNGSRHLRPPRGTPSRRTFGSGTPSAPRPTPGTPD